jgi:hypothetical protein
MSLHKDFVFQLILGYALNGKQDERTFKSWCSKREMHSRRRDFDVFYLHQPTDVSEA